MMKKELSLEELLALPKDKARELLLQEEIRRRKKQPPAWTMQKFRKWAKVRYNHKQTNNPNS